jgi:hypothetical protein
MTKQRNDKHSTEFGLWLRQEEHPINSKFGYQTTNIDYVWTNKRTYNWLLIEEKRYSCEVPNWQKIVFSLVKRNAEHDPKYKGFFYIIFEKTSPEDGRMWINNKEATKDELLKLLQFDEDTVWKYTDLEF